MHVLHLIKTSEGASWAIHLMKEVKKQNPNITFSVIVPSGGKHFEEYKEICRNVYEFKYDLNFSLFSNGLTFRKMVLKDKPDIIHSWFTQTTLYARFFLRDIKTPRLFQVVGPLHLENPIFNFFDRKSAQKNDYWIATSKYILNKYRSKNISQKKLFLNYAFIDVLKLLEKKKTETHSNFKTKFKIDSNTKIIGTASYIYPPKFYEKSGVKGHEILLEVFSKILQKRNDVVLVIAGATFGNNKKYEEEIRLKAQKISQSKIIFTGKYSNVYEVISNFDAFVYLSKSENLGGVFESLLFEIPTVSSNRGGLPELVLNNETGFTCDLSNIDEIVNKIEVVLDNAELTSRMKVAGKNKVLEIFEKEKLITQTMYIYNQVLNKNV